METKLFDLDAERDRLEDDLLHARTPAERAEILAELAIIDAK